MHYYRVYKTFFDHVMWHEDEKGTVEENLTTYAFHEINLFEILLFSCRDISLPTENLSKNLYMQRINNFPTNSVCVDFSFENMDISLLCSQAWLRREVRQGSPYGDPWTLPRLDVLFPSEGKKCPGLQQAEQSHTAEVHHAPRQAWPEPAKCAD